MFPYAYAFLAAPYGYYLLVGWLLLLLPVEFVINVAIWRSASRHPGRKAVAKGVKYLIVVMTLMAISNNYIFFARVKNLNLTRLDIGGLNSALPVMVDKRTRFDSVVVRSGVIIFNYTVLGATTADVRNRAAETKAIRCKPENLTILDAFRASSSVYKNESGEVLAAIP